MGAWADSFAGALASIRNATGVSVVYAHGDFSLTIDAATKGKCQFENLTDFGMIGVEGTDWLIPMSDPGLTLTNSVSATEVTVPMRGHTITETVGSVSLTFEVQSPHKDIPVWAWSDPGRTSIRVHTKLVETS